MVTSATFELPAGSTLERKFLPDPAVPAVLLPDPWGWTGAARLTAGSPFLPFLALFLFSLLFLWRFDQPSVHRFLEPLLYHIVFTKHSGLSTQGNVVRTCHSSKLPLPLPYRKTMKNLSFQPQVTGVLAGCASGSIWPSAVNAQSARALGTSCCG